MTTMKTLRPALLISVMIFLVLAACNPVKQVSKRLSGNWEIVRFEDKKINAPELVALNIGSLTLKADKTGHQVIQDPKFKAAAKDTLMFNWRNTENILQMTNADGEILQAWVIVKLKKKSQILKSVDEGRGVQFMHLKRNK